MKKVPILLNKQLYYLAYNGTAMLELQELYGSIKDLFEKMIPSSKEGFDILITCFSILIEQGELCRRYEGYDRVKIPLKEEIKALVPSYEIVAIYNAVVDAVVKGSQREVPEDENEEIDLGLMELQKKTN